MNRLSYRPELLVIMSLFMSSSLADSLCSVLLNRIQEELHMSQSLNEALNPLAFVGISLGMLFWGYHADHWGRRRVWLLGCALFIMSLIGCALSSQSELFLFFRWLQGFSGSATSVMSLVVIRDLFPLTSERSQAHAMINQSFALGPVLAYVFSTLPVDASNWRLSYWWLAALQLPLIYGVYRLPFKAHGQRSNVQWGKVQSLFKNKIFMRAAYTASLSIAVGLCYLSLMPQLMEHVFEAQDYYPYTLLFVGFIWWAGSPLAGYIHRHTEAPQGIRWGARIIILCAYLAALSTLIPHPSLRMLAYLICLISSMLGTGVIIPQAIGMGLHDCAAHAGVASAVLGCLYYGFASLIALFASQLPSHLLTMPVIFMIFGLITTRIHLGTPPSSTGAVDNTVENFRTPPQITDTEKT